MRFKYATALLALALSSCGFHLRGMVELPKWFHQVAVVSNDSNHELVNLLKSRLDSYHVEVNDNPTKADYTILIQNSLYEVKIISIGASTNPRQYQLKLTTQYQIQNRKGALLLPQRSIIATRQLTVNNDRILGSNDEETTLQREMRQDTVTQIMTTLSHTLKQTEPRTQ